jgi:NTP pyrophosphatase (non-canonical NTP hydrolase)
MIFDEDYASKARRTLSSNDNVIEHMIIGLVTEAGELMDAWKKHKFYGRDLDIQNIKEELGDIHWYLGILHDEIGYSEKEARDDNITKLQKRYPDKFKDVIKRDINNELSHM